jgi:lysine/ornithine N-monooxygenase
MRAVIADITDAVMPDMVYEAGINDYQGRKLIMYEKPEPRDGMLKTNPKYKNMTVDIIDAVMFNTEYEADIQVHRDREINMFKEHEMKMLKTTPKGKYDKNVNMDHVMDEKPEMTDIIDAVMLNTEYEDDIQVHQGGEINMFEEAETRMLKTNPKHKNVNVDIINAVKFNKEYEADIQVHRDREINMFKEPEIRMLKITPKGKDDKNVMDKKPEMTDIINAVILNTEYEASIQVHQDGETNMFEEAKTRMLKTNPKGKNNAAIPIEDPNTVQW